MKYKIFANLQEVQEDGKKEWYKLPTDEMEFTNPVEAEKLCNKLKAECKALNIKAEIFMVACCHFSFSERK